ncbi:hypothetical protein NC652_010687 [Populus alba x Populus x berolinensis]|nr:hypothetical protein NC652_010687 [Populus alba x Populus x berolinensis]
MQKKRDEIIPASGNRRYLQRWGVCGVTSNCGINYLGTKTIGRSSDSPLTFSLALIVLCMVIGKRLGPRSNLLQIIRSPDESEILLLNRDEEEHTAVP